MVEIGWKEDLILRMSVLRGDGKKKLLRERKL
jgi:hypothetical protein